MTNFYKVLAPDGESFNGGNFRYSLPTLNSDGSYTPGDWHSVELPVILCQHGFHLTTAPYNWIQRDTVIYAAEGHWIQRGTVIYAAEGRGATDSVDDKHVFESVRLLNPVQHENWWTETYQFVDALKNIPWLKPDGNPDPSWELFTADMWDVAGDAAWDAAGDTAGDAAWNAARNAARDAARNAAWDAARDAAGNAAENAARNAVGNAARNAAENVARNAAWDAALYAEIKYVCSGLSIDQKHIDHARARWNVWQKGYALLCDVDGVLYVYAKA